jgi:hypothetical protein
VATPEADICNFGNIWAGMAAAGGAHPLAGTIFYDLFRDTGARSCCCLIMPVLLA